MYSQGDIEEAVESGALSAEQAASFRRHVAARRGQPTVDEEYFRFILGFNDIFIAVACVLLIVAAGWVGSLIPPHIGGWGPSPFIGIFAAAAAWILSELFAPRRRTSLASILLVMALAYAVLFAVVLLAVMATGGRFQGVQTMGALGFAASAVATLAVVQHWRRFRVPFALAAAVGFAVLALVALLSAMFMPSPEDMMSAMMTSEFSDYSDIESSMARFQTIMLIAVLLSGIATFLYAMSWDASDRRRETERSEVGFWLHWLAAGLIVHSLISMLGIAEHDLSAGSAIALVLLYILFAIVALLTSRRAILIIGLIYLIYAVNALLGGGGSISGAMMAVFVVALVMFLLAFSWSQLRVALVEAMPAGLQARLPVVERSDGEDAVY